MGPGLAWRTALLGRYQGIETVKRLVGEEQTNPVIIFGVINIESSMIVNPTIRVLAQHQAVQCVLS